jgi:hypothetical protein
MTMFLAWYSIRQSLTTRWDGGLESDFPMRLAE